MARPVTERLVLLHAARKDRLSAEAEQSVLDSTASHVVFLQDLHLAVGAAIVRENDRRKAYEEAKHAGIDQGVLDEKFGNPPPLVVSDRANGVGIAPAEVNRAEFNAKMRKLDGPEVLQDQGVVEKVIRKGSTAEIQFVAKRHTYQEQTGCRETSKVDRITADGEIIYRVLCTGRIVEKTDVERKPSVRVPAKEARAIRPGDSVYIAYRAASRGRTAPKVEDGRVARVYAPETADRRRVLKQIGAFALQ